MNCLQGISMVSLSTKSRTCRSIVLRSVVALWPFWATFITVDAYGAQASDTTVALAQLLSSDAGDFAKMQDLANQAKARGAQLIVFPEESVFGWLNPDVFTKAAPIPGQYSDKFVEIAKKTGIWVAAGLAERGPKAGPGTLPNAYQAYDAGILVNPKGDIVIHHRQYNVIANAFDPASCKSILNQEKCQYTAGPLSDIKTVQTPFGKTALLVCADAYTFPPATALSTLKPQQADLLIVPWGITAEKQDQCGTDGFDATGYAASAASFLQGPTVIGANSVGQRKYGRFLPSVYCGTSGYADLAGRKVEPTPPSMELEIVQIPLHLSASTKANRK